MARRTSEGYVRRCDVALRARFPNLATRIFEVGAESYVISFDAAQQHAASILEEFDHQIRPATLQVTLSNAPLTGRVREIQPIDDSDLTRGLEGISFTRFDLYNLLNSRFPGIDIVDVRNVAGGALEAVVQGSIPAEARQCLLNYLDGLHMPTEWRIVSAEGPTTPPAYPYKDSIHILATKLTSVGRFAIDDERKFFETFDDAASGALQRADIIGPGDRARCLLDCTTGRQINLRQALMLYDEVWCVPPLSEGMDAFLADQALSRDDLLHAVIDGRLRFVLTYEERSSDLKFLEAAAERHKYAVLGRRMAGTLLLADVARSAATYRLRDPTFFPALRELSHVAAEDFGTSEDELLRAMLWPLSGVRGSVQSILDRGTKGTPASRLAERLADRLRTQHGVDLQLEAYFMAERAHLAHALGATVIPPLDEPPAYAVLARAIGQDLNFYASFNTKIAPAWVGNRDRRARREFLSEPLPLFSFDRDVPILEVLQDTDRGSTRRKGRALVERLADLPPELRADEIRKLKQELRANNRRDTSKLLSFETGDTLVALASTIFGFLYPPAIGLTGAGAKFSEKLRSARGMDLILDTFAQDALAIRGGNHDLDFLSRIDRVATLISSDRASSQIQ